LGAQTAKNFTGAKNMRKLLEQLQLSSSIPPPLKNHPNTRHTPGTHRNTPSSFNFSRHRIRKAKRKYPAPGTFQLREFP